MEGDIVVTFNSDGQQVIGMQSKQLIIISSRYVMTAIYRRSQKKDSMKDKIMLRRYIKRACLCGHRISAPNAER